MKSPTPGPHLVLYDGACGLCHGLIQFVLPRDADGLFHFAPIQGASAARHLARFGGVPSRLTTVYVMKDYQQGTPARLVRARAALFILRSLGWPWRAATLLAVLPTAWLDRAYDAVARNRYNVLGRRDTCLVPGPEFHHRFLDLPERSELELKGAP